MDITMYSAVVSTTLVLVSVIASSCFYYPVILSIVLAVLCNALVYKRSVFIHF